MKKYLLAGALVVASSSLALAADIEPAPEPVYDWTGFYLGLNAGAAWNNSSVDNNFDQNNIDPAFANQIEDGIEGDQTAFTGGAQAGYNWQIDSIVLGLEADFNYLGFDESRHRNFGGGAPAALVALGTLAHSSRDERKIRQTTQTEYHELFGSHDLYRLRQADQFPWSQIPLSLYA